MDFHVDMRYDITHFVLAGLYFLLCLLSIFCMLRLCVVGHFKRWQLFFHPIFFLGTLGMESDSIYLFLFFPLFFLFLLGMT
jgi:hypothetical protein